MSSNTPLTDSINNLTTYANSVTGASDTNLSDAVATLASGYGGGGGSSGGLSNLVDVTNMDYQYGYMFSQIKNGNTVGGTVTYSEAFPNTETLILSTGLTTLHGIVFIDPSADVSSNSGSEQTSKYLEITLKSNNKFNVFGIWQNAGGQYITSREQGTKYEQAPINGTLRFDGGDIYYTGRYNKNANYQILKVNTLYEWLAW